MCRPKHVQSGEPETRVNQAETTVSSSNGYVTYLQGPLPQHPKSPFLLQQSPATRIGSMKAASARRAIRAVLREAIIFDIC